ncbi:hypothetical protein RB595_005138 [Gaeumannomyces hyphopodioides]
MAASHPTLTTPYEERAKTVGHPLSSYLLRLMDLKASNLCLSADVTNARELLHLADKVGPSIVVLKTHYDLVTGWDYNPQTGTGAKLATLARRHGFLIFEDRKFADIGKTVQLQYTGGTARIVEWAHIVNVNIQAGKEVVRAMAEAAAHWRERIKYEVRTSVTVGTPISDSFDEDQDEEVSPTATSRSQQTSTQAQAQRRQPSPHHESAAAKARKNSGQAGLAVGPVPIPQPYNRDSAEGRKGSIVSITTVTQSYEPADSPRLSKSMTEGGIDDVVFPGIEEAPLERGLLILAQMSTGGCLMTPEYTQACVEAARDNKGFVMGFVAQQALNSAPDDSFIHMTPGCKLPPEGDDEDGRLEGDGLDQQYNTPSLLIGDKGTDIVIVGRGITKAGDPQSEAERYRRIAWKAYLARLPQP